MKKNPWNTQMQDPEIDQKFIDILVELRKNNYGKNLKYQEQAPLELSDYLENLYFKQEYGIKILARAFGICYSGMRNSLIKYMNRPIRAGRNVTTNRVRKFRSERIMGEKNPWYDWPNQSKNPIENSKGIQGYYKKKNGELVWLRSSWEYIYAKWLDKQNINWKIEEKVYVLSNKERYRPDFFIYNDKNQLQYIVEIKGYYKNRINKYELFKKEHNI